MGKTLKIYSYRGINVYIRWMGNLWYETLIAFKGGIYAHQLQLLKPIGKERRNDLEERHKGATTELMMIANSLVDDLHAQRSFKNKIKNYIKKINEQIHERSSKREATEV